jgi:hypothetical protein
MQFTKGQQVQQVLPAPIVGEVVGFSVDQETGAVLVRVEWADTEGHAHSRYFGANELQASAQAPAAA